MVTARWARNRNGPKVNFQLLIYPNTDLTMDGHAYQENNDGSRERLHWYRDHYLAGGDQKNPDASPLYADDLQGLPPTHFIFASNDVMRAEGEAYAEKLRAAGVSVTMQIYEETTHGFFGWLVTDVGRKAIADAGNILRQALSESN